MPLLTLGDRAGLAAAREAVAAAARPLRSRRRRRQSPANDSWGTVILPFGRYFAGRADLLTRERFKTIVPIDGVSPFSGVGEPDPRMQHFADSERVNDRVRIDVRKDLAARLAQAGADYLVLDNSTALMWHREVNGRLYTVVSEHTDIMDELWNADEPTARSLAVKLSHAGLTDRLRATYDAFVRACLDAFDPARIVLVRSHVPRFWIAEDGTVAPTNADRRDARFLAVLDDYFAQQTGCRVADAALGHVARAAQWQAFDDRLRRTIEAQLVELCRPRAPAPAVGAVAVAAEPSGGGAADHVVDALRHGRPLDWGWLRRYFAAGGASPDDLLALACVQQQAADADVEAIRACVQRSVADPRSWPVAATRRRFDGSLRALRNWRWCRLRVPRGEQWTPQVALHCGNVVLRFLGDGSIQRVRLARISESDVAEVVDGRLPVTPLSVTDVLASWPVYLARGRRGVTAAIRVVVSGVDELVDTCAWLDWAQVLDDERVVITTGRDTRAGRGGPRARTDLSFLFDTRVRIGTVGGGLMDQITHIALFDDLCRPHGLDYYIDDMRYTWWRSHNGFEASRLAPGLERRRLTRLVSQALTESFREEVVRTRLPWVFNQSRVWYELGLRDATVVTRDYVNSRRLMELDPDFPVLVYGREEELGQLLRHPPSAVCFYTTQHRIRVAAESASAIRQVFSYRHLDGWLDPELAILAERLRSRPHVAVHIRRGDYLHQHFDTRGWHSQMSHYVEALEVVESELGPFDAAVFSDDLEFVEAHAAEYGLDRVRGDVRFVRGNRHYKSIFDSYLMSLCPVIVGSVGSFAATTSLLADPPSTFIRARPGSVRVEWRRVTEQGGNP